jgi:SAM-dependent methyltransferase
MNEPEALDANSHVFRHDITIQAEVEILSEFLLPGMKVLDVGCAATGRSALLLREFDCEVHSIEINVDAILEFGAKAESKGIDLVAADLGHLPYVDGYFDLVLVAFHGMDYLLTKEIRHNAYQQIGRVLKPAGKLVFNGFNRLGIVFNPQVIASPYYRKAILKHLAKGYLFTPTFIDENNLRLHQATPNKIIREVEDASALTFDYATNKSGNTRNFWMVSLLASAPYYVFSQ